MLALIDAIPPGALYTFAAALLAHVLADFVFQTNWVNHNKADPPVFGIHILIVFILTNAALGGAWQVAAVISGAHLVIDAIKVWILPAPFRSSFSAFVGDQIAHLLTLMIAAALWPMAAPSGIWSDILPQLYGPAIVLSGAILSVIAGGYAVGLLTARFHEHITEDSLPDAGRLIGQLERGLIFLLIWVGQPAGVGFLVAAKSILRFDSAKDHKTGEYVIIGTLASFAWALAIAYATTTLLEIAPQTP